MAMTVKNISFKANEEDISLLQAIQQRWNVSQSDAIRFCMRDTLRRAHSRRRKAQRAARREQKAA
jgi:hypothetical protein